MFPVLDKCVACRLCNFLFHKLQLWNRERSIECQLRMAILAGQQHANVHKVPVKELRANNANSRTSSSAESRKEIRGKFHNAVQVFCGSYAGLIVADGVGHALFIPWGLHCSSIGREPVARSTSSATSIQVIA